MNNNKDFWETWQWYVVLSLNFSIVLVLNIIVLLLDIQSRKDELTIRLILFTVILSFWALLGSILSALKKYRDDHGVGKK